MIELINILNSMQGNDEQGNPKSVVAVSENIIDVADDFIKVKDFSFTTPTTNIIVNGDFIILDLVFPKTGASELRNAWRYLKTFGENQNKTIDGAETNVLEFTIVPLEYHGKYFCTMINPVFWALQPSAPGYPADSIRMLFEKGAVNFLEGEEIDEKQLDKEIENDIIEEQRKFEIDEQRRVEREEYLDRINSKFNHMDQ